MSPIVVEGKVRTCELEGRHFELEASGAPGERLYILIPAADAVARQISANTGRWVRVKGYIHCGPGIFMHGVILRVTEVSSLSPQPGTGDAEG